MSPERSAGAVAACRPVVCYVTDALSLEPTSDLPDAICNAIDCDVDWIQLREKYMSAHERLELTRYAIEAAHNASDDSAHHARVFVNDRLDVALAGGAAGVHLGGESIPVDEAVRWCGDLRSGGQAPAGFAIGVSCHSLEDARDAAREGARYIFFGPVFDTPSKRGFGEPQGLDRLSEICTAVNIPVIAIGGVNEENAASCVRAGASGIASIRLFQKNVDGDGTELRSFIARIHAL